jgi:hypothetical protein
MAQLRATAGEVRRLGYEKDGVVRARCACSPSAEEIARLIETLREMAASS